MTRQLAPCGTYAAYQRHKKRGEPVDVVCQLAARQYQAGYRAAHTDVRDRERAHSRLKGRAYRQLAREYPARFLEIVEALRALAGES